MKRFATLMTAFALVGSMSTALAQVSGDDYSVLVGPQATKVVSQANRLQVMQARDLARHEGAFEAVTLYQSAVAPRAARTADSTSRAQVILERDQARASGAFEPGAEYLNVVGAPTTGRYAAKPAAPAGQ